MRFAATTGQVSTPLRLGTLSSRNSRRGEWYNSSMAIASTGAQQAVEVHFDEVAPDYDHWKKKNWYYYDTLYSVARRYARNVTNLLDVGCGTGSMILAVAPKKAVGIDVSHGMLE